MAYNENMSEREQAEAALVDCVAILRRVGISCVVGIGMRSGSIYRLVSAPNACEQTHLLLTVAHRINNELGQLATHASTIADLGKPDNYLDDDKGGLDT